MKCSSSRYLAFTLLSYSPFSYLDAIFDQLLVVEYQVLFQSRVGDVATLCVLLNRDITVSNVKAR